MSEPTWDDTEPTWDDTESTDPIQEDYSQSGPQMEPADPMQPPEEKMGKGEAALTTFDPMFLNTSAAGAGAALGQMAGGPDLGDRPQQEIEKATIIADKLKGQGKLGQYEKMMANIEDLKKLQNPTREAFYGGREDFKAKEEKAFKDQPATAWTSTLASGLLTPMPGAMLAKGGKMAQVASKVLPNLDEVAKVAKISKRLAKAEKMGLSLTASRLLKAKRAAQFAGAAKEGVKFGAIAGMTKGDAKLLNGDIGGFIKDTLIGGSVGGASGAAFTKGLEGTSRLLNSTGFLDKISQAFQRGNAGQSVSYLETRHGLRNLAEEYIHTFKAKVKSTGTNIGAVTQDLEAAGYTVNGADDLIKIKDALKDLEPSTRKKYMALVNTLEDFYDGGKEYVKFMKKLEKQVVQQRAKDAGKVDMAKLTMQKKQMRETIKNQIKNISDDDLGIVSSKDILPEGGPEVMSQVKHTIKEEMTPEGITQKHSFDSQDVTPYAPSGIKRVVDAESGRAVYSVQDASTGKITALASDLEKAAVNPSEMTLAKTKELTDQLGKYLGDKDMDLSGKTFEAVRDGYKNLKEKMFDAIKNETDKEKLKGLNKVYTALSNMKGMVDFSQNNDPTEVKALTAMVNFISGAGDKNDDIFLSKFIEQVRDTDPKLARQIQQQISDMRIQVELSGGPDKFMMGPGVGTQRNPVGVLINYLIGGVGKPVIQGANALGLAKKAGQDTLQKSMATMGSVGKSLADRTLSIVEASPDDLQRLVTKIQDGSDASHKLFLGPLKKALGSKPRTKQSVMFGLSQQKAFIDMVNSLGAEAPTNKEK